MTPSSRSKTKSESVLFEEISGCSASAISQIVESLAPSHLAYDWDNVGFQIGDPQAQVQRVAIGLEVTDGFMEFALRNQCQMLITHHPLLFRPIKRVVTSDPAQKRMLHLAQNGLALHVAHTNLDRVRLGTNGILAQLVGLENVSILEPSPLQDQTKLVLFVPKDYSQKLIEALSRAGAGEIGDYSHCTFRSAGIGTFQGKVGQTQPFFGEAGRLEQVEEDRLECLVPSSRLQAVMEAAKAAHPYEEMAADAYPLIDWSRPYGLGVVGELPGPKVPLKDFGHRIREATGAEFLQRVGGKPSLPIRRVGIITGSPGPSIHAAKRAGVDVLITGEIGYHLAMEALDLGLVLILCGHSVSERIFAPAFSTLLQDRIGEKGYSVECLPFTGFPEPFSLMD
jgi:dinuclear metal center YbgI/SA1388 family protein